MTVQVVTFNYTTWSAMFPELVPPALVPGVSSAQAAGAFLRATLMFSNNTANPAFPDGNMEALLYLLTAHIAALGLRNAGAGGQVVGRMNSASEGSVSVGLEWNGSGSPSEAWYLQTGYGAEFWQATGQYRTFRYLPQRSFVQTFLPGAFRRRRW